MPLTLAQFATASVDATLQSQFQGSILKLAGYIVNGDPATSDATAKATRLAWATAILGRTSGQQYLVDAAARFLRYSVGTSGVFLNAASLVILDSDVDSMVAIIAQNIPLMRALEVTAVQP